jgi:hypothetical protein
MLDGPRHVIRTIVNTGTTDTNLIVINVSDLVPVPTHLVVEEIWYDVQGFASVLLEWDATADSVIAQLSEGSGYLDWREYGGMTDPQATGTTGDILITTPTVAAAETYTITLKCRKKFA